MALNTSSTLTSCNGLQIDHTHPGAGDCRYLKIAGVCTHLVDAGSGPAVLLIHGAQSWSYTWRFQTRMLVRAGYRVLAPDLPGHGYSDSPVSFDYSVGGLSGFIQALLDSLGLEHVTLVAHAAGAVPALDFTIRYPERVAGLVLSSACGVPHSEPHLWKVLRFPILSPVARTAATEILLRETLSQGFHNPRLVTDELVAAYHAPLRRAGAWKASLRLEQAWRPAFVEESLDCIRCPALVVWGQDDPWHPVEMALEFGGRLCSSQVELLPNCGHFPQEETPLAFNSLFLPFLNRIYRPRRDEPLH